MDILSVILEVLHVSADEHVSELDKITMILVLNWGRREREDHQEEKKG